MAMREARERFGSLEVTDERIIMFTHLVEWPLAAGQR